MKTSNLEVEDDGFVKHFLAPLRRPQVITNALLVSIFVAGALACLDIRLTNHAIALQNAGSIETVFLAAELNGEAGPDFVRERAMFAGLLSKYAQRMEKRAPRTIFVGQLREAAAILAAPAPRQEGSSNAIRRAAALLTCAARSGINEARGVKAPEAASISFSAEIVKEHLTAARQSGDSFQEHPTLQAAELACMDSRLAAESILRGAIPAAQNDSHIREFTTRLESLSKQMLAFAETLAADEQHRIKLYARNIDRRQVFISKWNQEGPAAAQATLVASLTND